jgi:hypothetical protein
MQQSIESRASAGARKQAVENKARDEEPRKLKRGQEILGMGLQQIWGME